jgi:hypothetical protein
VSFVFKFIEVLSVAEDWLLPLRLVGMLKELIKSFHYLRVLRIYFDLKLNTEQDRFFMHSLRHPSYPVSFKHMLAFLLYSVVFKHQILVGFMSILGFKCVLGIF